MFYHLMKNILALNLPVLDIIVENCSYKDLQILQNIFDEIFSNSKYYQRLIKQKEELEYRLNLIRVNLWRTTT